MDNDETSFTISQNEINNEKKDLEIKENEKNNINNTNPQNVSNINQQNNQNNEKEIEEMDGTDNLRFKDNINNNYLNTFINRRLDSCDSAAQYKFSIDLPNAPKQKLHEYLNDDLLNALEYSPNFPNLNSGITNNRKLTNENTDNSQNNLLDFSLYPQSHLQSNDNNNSNNNQNKANINNNPDFSNKNNLNNFNTYNMNNNFIINNNFNNYQNYNYINNININGNLNYNMNNPQIYVPSRLRNKDQINNQEIIYGQNHQYNNNIPIQNQKKEEHINSKNKFDGNKKNAQNSKKEGKNKKHFEVRAGDWTCTKCNNLNFSFRNKCNRCGLPKELNKKFEQINPDIFTQNQNYQLMNGINPNFIYGNTNVFNNVNIINNPNNVNYYPK